MSRARPPVVLLGRILRETRRNRVPFLAAAVAFYGFVSIIPLFLLALALGNIAGLPVESMVRDSTGEVLTPTGQRALVEAVRGGAGIRTATVVGIGFLGWSALRVFRGLDVAFSQVYGHFGEEPLQQQLIDAVLVVVLIPLALGVSALLGVGLPVARSGAVWEVVGWGSLLFTLALVFLPIYYTFPDVPVTVREVLPGVVFAATGWSLLATGFGMYTDFVGGFQLYGVLGAGLLLVTWMYLGGIIIMVGAVANAVLSGRTLGEEPTDDGEDQAEREPAPDVSELGREVRALREELDAKTVSRSDLEADLRRYVRWRLRRGKARGWGPYLVLLYGTAMTLGAFYWLEGGWAILAMIVVWLSTLGLYVLMVLFGATLNVTGLPGRLLEAVRER
ncbi:MAG: YihY/virulence factor BrkB family protein, partial [Halodesulfurarchaeum sp.]